MVKKEGGKLAGEAEKMGGDALKEAGTAALTAGEGMLEGKGISASLKDAGNAAEASLIKDAKAGASKLENEAKGDAMKAVAGATKKRRYMFKSLLNKFDRTDLELES